MNQESERMWEEAMEANFKVLYQHLFVLIKERPSQGSRSPAQISIAGPRHTKQGRYTFNREDRSA